jgi:shikimate kinase
VVLAQPQNIILVGFMASGKSHVGRILSQYTGWPLVDADDEIVRRAGKPIAQIFEDQGEAAFRALEQSVTAELCAGNGRIIAAGGGAFVDAANRKAMLGGGTVFCLSARPETIHRRIIGADPNAAARPMLAGDDPLERIKSLLEQRAAAYAQAHHTIETDGLTVEQVAGRVLELLASDLPTEKPAKLIGQQPE